MAFMHVLVPTDFSEPASQALRYAVEEATLHRAQGTLLHVLPLHTETNVYYVTGMPLPSFDLEGSGVGTPAPVPPTVVRRDLSEEALARLHDLIPDAFRGTWGADES